MAKRITYICDKCGKEAAVLLNGNHFAPTPDNWLISGSRCTCDDCATPADTYLKHVNWLHTLIHPDTRQQEIQLTLEYHNEVLIPWVHQKDHVFSRIDRNVLEAAVLDEIVSLCQRYYDTADEWTELQRQLEHDVRRSGKFPDPLAESGYVYLFFGERGQYQQSYKIGQSLDPYTRLTAVANSYDTQSKLICAIPTPYYKELEILLHSKYAPKRVRYEWFALDQNDVAYLITIARQSGGIVSE